MIDDENNNDNETQKTMMTMEHRYLRPAGRGSSMDEATLKREDAGVSRRQTNKQGAGWKIVGIQSITYFRCWGAGQHSQFHGKKVAIQVPSPNTGCVKRNYLVQHSANMFNFLLQYVSSHHCEHHQVMFVGTASYRTGLSGGFFFSPFIFFLPNNFGQLIKLFLPWWLMIQV